MHNRFGLERWQSLAISAPVQAIVRRWNARKVGKAWMLETRLVFILARPRRTGQEDLSARRFFRAQTSSRSAPRLFRKKYTEAQITIEKNATTAASIANAPKSTRAPGTAAN